MLMKKYLFAYCRIVLLTDNINSNAYTRKPEFILFLAVLKKNYGYGKMMNAGPI
jgi:hypothetical protein